MSCTNMCPEKERNLRIREKLVHFFEFDHQHRPNRMVKEYKRSAAGLELNNKADLRTLNTLQETVNFLLTEVLHDERKPFYFVYEFIFDRLRAVRQEMVIQEMGPKETVELLEPMIVFLSYSNYRLSEEDLRRFDPKICADHVQETLKKALVCYDELNSRKGRPFRKGQERIESIYLLFNLGSIEALNRGVFLKGRKVDLGDDFKLAWAISLSVWHGNIRRALKLINELPPLLRAVVNRQVPKMRRDLLLRFSHAYNSPNVNLPLEHLVKNLNYLDENNLALDLKYFNISVNDKNLVHFDKKTFNISANPVKCRQEFPMDLISI